MPAEPDEPDYPFDKPLREFSDEELLTEARLRRQRRGILDPEPTTTTSSARQSTPQQRARHLASLELEPDATRDEIRAAYARLRAKYAPFATHPNAERRQAAEALLASLSAAFEALEREA